MVSGVPGRIFKRRRSANSLTNALREAKPKSASKVVASTVVRSVCHQREARSWAAASCSSTSKSCATRATAAGAEVPSPRIQLNKRTSHR